MVNENMLGNFFVWDGIEFSGQSAKMCHEASEFNIHNPFTLIHKNKNSIDYYHFANNSKNKQINQVYLANIDLLNRFISYFTDRVNQSKFLFKAYDLKFDLSLDPQHQLAFENTSIMLNRDEFSKSLHFEPMSRKL